MNPGKVSPWSSFTRDLMRTDVLNWLEDLIPRIQEIWASSGEDPCTLEGLSWCRLVQPTKTPTKPKEEKALAIWGGEAVICVRFTDEKIEIFRTFGSEEGIQKYIHWSLRDPFQERHLVIRAGAVMAAEDFVFVPEQTLPLCAWVSKIHSHVLEGS